MHIHNFLAFIFVCAAYLIVQSSAEISCKGKDNRKRSWITSFKLPITPTKKLKKFIEDPTHQLKDFYAYFDTKSKKGLNLNLKPIDETGSWLDKTL